MSAIAQSLCTESMYCRFRLWVAFAIINRIDSMYQFVFPLLGSSVQSEVSTHNRHFLECFDVRYWPGDRR